MILINLPTKTNKEIPNIALAYIGTISNSKIIDLNTRTEPFRRFLDNQDKILGISVQRRTYEQYKKIADLYKKNYPNSKIISVSGIINVQCCHPFLALEKNLNFSQQFNDSLPFPNYELLDSFNVFKNRWLSGKWPYAILTSIGCPYQCIYCAARNRKCQARSAENCYQELKQAKNKYNIKSFQILDDCFNFDEQRVIDFCKKIKPLNLVWYCNNGLRINRFNENLAKIMAESGCKGVSFGIESISQDILNFINKGLSVTQIGQTINIAKKYFRIVNGFFIIGLPGSTYQKDLETLHWTLKKRINAHFGYYLPINGKTNNDFYGEGAEPISSAYPKKLQKRIFDLSGFIREKPSIPLLTNNIINILKYDLLYLPFYFTIGFKKL